MKLLKWTACGLLFAALAMSSCQKQEEEVKDTTPAELKSFALLKADNAALDKDYAPELISDNMIIRVKGGGSGKTFVATLTAGENDEIKVNDAVVPASGKASFDATFPADIVVTNTKSGLKASYVVKIGKILQLIPTKIPSFTETADADHGTAIEVAANPSDGQLYIAYNRKLKVGDALEKNNNISVAKWNGGTFDVQGSGIADNSTRQPYLEQFAFGPDGAPYVVIRGEKTANVLGVKTIKNNAWGDVAEQEIAKEGTFSTSFGEVGLFFDNGKPHVVLMGSKKDYNRYDAFRHFFDGSSWQSAVGIPGLPKFGDGSDRGSNAGMFYCAQGVTAGDAAYVVASVNWFGYYIFKVQNNTWTKLVEDFKPAGEIYGVPSNLSIKTDSEGNIFVFAASGAAAKMQIYTFADNKLEPHADPLTFSAGSLSGSIAESAKFFITPEGTIVVVRINKESSLPEFCVLDENRQWTEWQTANDVKQYSGFDGAMAPDGTILCAYTSRDEAKVSRIESFTIGMEPDILPE